MIGFVFANHLGIGMVVCLVAAWFIQAAVFRLSMRAKGRFLSSKVAYIASSLVLAADIFVVPMFWAVAQLHR
jgi:hypothetical protein